jgi:RNA polymerase sigma-70 factor (ECF subfamily)
MAASLALGAAAQPGTATVQDFSAFYDDHFDFVWRSLRRLGVPESALDDATQEVFVVAFRRQRDFEGRSSLKTWLFGIAWNRARELARGARRRPQAALAESLEQSSEADAEQAAMRSQELRLVYRVLGELTPERRAVLVMTEMEEMSAAEIVEVLGIPLNTVYSRLRLARRDFEAALKRCRAQAERSVR